MMEPDVIAVPLQDAIAAEDGTPAAPKRGRGRPRGSRTLHRRTPVGTASPRPRPERAPNRAAPAASLKARIGGMLVLVNTMVLFVPGLGADALSPGEVDALAEAMDSQCRQSPRFRKYVEAALSAGSGGQLVGVVLMIAARRAGRHNLIPNGYAIDAALAPMFGDSPGAATPTAPLPSTAPSNSDDGAVETPSEIDVRPAWTPPHEPEQNGAAPFNFEATVPVDL